MPYIPISNRSLVKTVGPKTAGELNYLFTKACLVFLAEKGESYETYNAIVGALECAKLEFARRLIAKYEDKKIQENGDVYP